MGRSTLENTTPLRMSAFWLLTKRSTAWRATSGFCWSSTTIRSTGRPPSLPPACLMPRVNPSRMSIPYAAPGPDSVLRNPTLIWSAACSGEPKAIPSASAAMLRFMVKLPFPFFCLATIAATRPLSSHDAMRFFARGSLLQTTFSKPSGIRAIHLDHRETNQFARVDAKAANANRVVSSCFLHEQMRRERGSTECRRRPCCATGRGWSYS